MPTKSSDLPMHTSPSTDRIIVTPAQLDLESHGRRDYLVAFEHDSDWREYHLPLTVWVGPDAKPGRGVLATGANHGNEYEGPIGLKHVLHDIRAEDVAGRIIVVPVLNPAAFVVGTRISSADDRVNLNRAFVDGAGSHPAMAGVTHRIARFVREHLFPHAHVTMDFHAGGNVARFALCLSYHRVDDAAQAAEMWRTARDFGAPFVFIYQNLTPGLLPSDAERLGKIALGAELGWGEAVNPAGVAIVRRGFMAAAQRHGQLRAGTSPQATPVQPRLVEAVTRDCYLSAPWPGHYEPLHDCGTEVRAGELIGFLHDFHRIDEPPLELRARVSGVLLAQAWAARVQPGQHIAVIAQEVAPPAD